MEVSVDDFLNLRKSLPIVDVRSEGEFGSGHIVHAINIPLLNNSEREKVGTIYKQVGQKAAIHEGFRLVGPRLIEIVSQVERVSSGKELLVHCWRGGMRSSNFSQFAGMAGVRTSVLKGGYKAYRQRALDSFRRPLQLILLTGCTGSGKSEVLRELRRAGEQILDLEGLANHKGSAFGGLLMPPQPTTEQFQNDLFEEILRLNPFRRIWIEDESIAIGKIFIPPDFWQQMLVSPLVKMEVERQVRIERLVSEYGPADREEFLSIMMKITKKLGGQNLNDAKAKLLEGKMADVIDILLTYYDKAYLESISRRQERIHFSLEWNGKEPASYARELIRAADHNMAGISIANS